jgi:magnesium transporter
LLAAYACEGGALRRLPEPSDDDLRAAAWIDLVQSSSEETERVARATGVRVPSQAEINEIETSSRLASRDGGLYLSMPMATVIDGSPRGVSMGFVLTPDRLLTIRFAPSRTFDNFTSHATDDRGVRKGPAHVLVGLLEAIIDRQADVLEQVSADLEALSHRVFSLGARAGGRRTEDRMLRATLGDLGRLSDLLSHIRQTQVGAARIAPYVNTAADWLPDDLHPRLATLQRDIESIRDFGTHLTETLQFLLDATLGFINIAQNNVMKVLTVASVVGIPPVLIAGIYGMNFKGMPEYDWSWGYAWGLGLIVVTALIPLAIFRISKWI